MKAKAKHKIWRLISYILVFIAGMIFTIIALIVIIVIPNAIPNKQSEIAIPMPTPTSEAAYAPEESSDNNELEIWLNESDAT